MHECFSRASHGDRPEKTGWKGSFAEDHNSDVVMALGVPTVD